VKESAFYFWRRELAQGGVGGAKRQEGDRGEPEEKALRGEKPPSPSRRTTRRRAAEARFVPVRVVTGGDAVVSGVRGPPGGVEILVREGRVIRVQAGFDRQVLAEVLRVLEGGSC
jgi:hypothetical protein